MIRNVTWKTYLTSLRDKGNTRIKKKKKTIKKIHIFRLFFYHQSKATHRKSRREQIRKIYVNHEQLYAPYQLSS